MSRVRTLVRAPATIESAGGAPAEPPPPDRVAPTWIRRWLAPGVAVLVCAGALALLHHELRDYHYQDIVRSVRAIGRRHVGAALVLTLCGYLALPGYDALALRYVGRSLSAGRVALAAITAYAFSQTLGFSVLTGASIRFRFWSAWGLSASEIAQAVAFTTISFWLGIVAIAGVVFVVDPVTSASIPGLPFGSTRPLGVLFLAAIATYVAWSLARPAPLVIGSLRLPSPPFRTVVAQILVSALDWALAASALYVLLPPADELSLPTFIAVYILGQTLGLVSHVPGGLGVFESIVVLLLRPYLPPAPVLGALLAYRAIYYLLPFAIAVGLLAVHELARTRAGLARLAALAGQWVPSVVPRVLSLTTFAAGVVLLFSGATPEVATRLHWLDRYFPETLVDLAHLLASVAGAGLLILARGLQRRLDAAYVLTAVLLGVGIFTSLLKGLDYEEALILALTLAALLPARRHFYRTARLGAEQFTPGWIAAVLIAVAAAFALGLFSFKRHLTPDNFWATFTASGGAARFLRGTLGTIAAVAVLAMVRVMRPSRPEPSLPTDADLARARAVIARADDVNANVALLGDKELLFSESGQSFLMYGVLGRSWIALGDPVGRAEERAELAWQFREIADRHGGWTVFYQVGRQNLPLYIDLGLTLLKIGEDAHVPLDAFSLEGGARKGLRRTQRAVEKDGGTFEIVQPDALPPLVPELRAVSDSWLAAKRTREKGFSIGYFDERYLRHFPLGLVRRAGQIVAFANIWRSGDGRELSVDLMRFSPDAPSGVMEYLFIELMLWGKREGFTLFDLGMAPLSGFQPHQLAPLWTRLGAMVYRHAEHFYNFQGLRLYKEKFDPVWEPRYLASPSGFALPRVLANVAALIAGGLRGVVRK